MLAGDSHYPWTGFVVYQRSPLAHRQDPNTTIQGVRFIRYHSSARTEHCIIH